MEKNTSFWYDDWLGDGAIADYIHQEDIDNSGMRLGITVAEVHRKGSWRIPSFLYTAISNLKSKLECIQLKDTLDKVIWKANKGYSVQDAYKFLKNPGIKATWSDLVWNKYVLPRHKFILWMVLKEKLQTKSQLAKKGMKIDIGCCYCGEEETIDHLICLCWKAQEIWKIILK